MAQIAPGNRGLRLVVRYTVLTLIAAIFSFPLIFMVISSLKPSEQLLADAHSFRALLPVGDISLGNYFAAFQRAPVGRFVFNSVLVTSVTVLLSLALCSTAAFAFVFVQWKGRDLILTVILATLIVPFETIAIPLLLEASKLPWLGSTGITWGWLNSYRVQIIPFIADGLTIYLFVQYFKDLPQELIEAARVEGASWFQIYRRVVMPLSGPILATAAILKFLAMYNQYLWPIMVTQEEQYRPVMVGLQYFFQLNRAWGEIMAYLSLITVPVLAFYLYLQRAFIASIASTGVKG
ncbi:MAG: carbohydrate ABC transporter permease [Alphaproteobacteria bacterium]